jgi:Skp family chaperone for outer membrane proteins
MKIKTAILVCLAIVVALFMTGGHGWADPDAKTGLFGSSKSALKPVAKVGVVSILKVFQKCKRNEKYRQTALAEQAKANAELDKLSKEIEAEEAGLKTLKVGSDDYLARVKQVVTAKASLQAQQDFYKQQAALKEQQWAEAVYKDVLKIVAEVAKEKGMDIVLEKDEPEFPTSNYSELMTVISTHKVLYSSGCEDISDEVLARLDAQPPTLQSSGDEAK